MNANMGIRVVAGLLAIEGFLLLLLGANLLLHLWGYVPPPSGSLKPGPEVFLIFGTAMSLLSLGIIWIAYGLLKLRRRAYKATFALIISSLIVLLPSTPFIVAAGGRIWEVILIGYLIIGIAFISILFKNRNLFVS